MRALLSQPLPMTRGVYKRDNVGGFVIIIGSSSC